MGGYSLTLDNKYDGTDSFLKAQGTNAKIVIKNLDQLIFKTTTAFASKNPTNHNPLITSNGGSIEISNINKVQFGTAENRLQVDQISHQNWGGGDITFKNIGTLEAYAKGTAFMVQHNSGGTPSLNFENIDTVDINAGDSRIGIHAITVQVSQNIPNADQILYVNNVKNFNVTGGQAGIWLADKTFKVPVEPGHEWSGSSAIKATINAENINLLGTGSNVSYGMVTQLANTDASGGSNVVDISASQKITMSGSEAGFISSNKQKDAAAKNNTISISAPVVELSATSQNGSALTNTQSVVTINSDQATLTGTNAIRLSSDNASISFAPVTSDDAMVKLNGAVSAGESTLLSFENSSVTQTTGNFVSQGTVQLGNSSLTTLNGTINISQLSGENASILMNNLDKGTLVIGANSVNDLYIDTPSALTAELGAEGVAEKYKDGAVSIANKDDGSYTIHGQGTGLTSEYIIDPTNSSIDYLNGGNAESALLSSVKHFNAANLTEWRYEVNHLSDRLGDVRNQNGNLGAWARVYGADIKTSDSVSTQVKMNSIQVGADTKVADNWIVGGAFSYTDTDGDFNNGTASADTYGLAVYATGFMPCGAYIDLIGRVGRISSDVTLEGSDASYDNTAFGLSAEVGYKYDITNVFFVTPQVELSYGYANGDDFTIAHSQGDVRVEQDNFTTLVGRAGLQAGANLPNDAGLLYVMASVNHDFNGDTKADTYQGIESRSISEDLGGTWFSYGVGLQLNIKESLSIYGSLARANGSDYQEDYRYSAGLRYMF